MSVRMRGEGNPLALLVGMQTGAATVASSMDVSQKVKNATTLKPSNGATGYSPKNTKTLIKKDIHAPMLTAASFTIAKLRKQPNWPSKDEWAKKVWCIYTMEYYSAIKKMRNLAIGNMNGPRDYNAK